ncbi:DUF6714 family protein [Aeoliella mucimassa]|uniref:Uncharacterized protein n=1 Tax=Aeoliella mucimassa TaxID=2527972 RepID=A0A518AKU9_9BACT|nr:DUF6714 family protein [Aeoliella mucimassa]QDU55357.1 hypothetical protein Pan181_15460 [Aeoliella mucimassa]
MITQDELTVLEHIESAFRGITLGEGVGLHQAQGLDDYASEEELDLLRLKDEKDDWSKIDASDLNNCYSSLSFFDARGMQFHLPAFLIADLKGLYNHDIAFTLCLKSENASLQFSLLNSEQRKAVRNYLVLRLNDLENGPAQPMIEESLETRWSESSS